MFSSLRNHDMELFNIYVLYLGFLTILSVLGEAVKMVLMGFRMTFFMSRLVDMLFMEIFEEF